MISVDIDSIGQIAKEAGSEVINIYQRDFDIEFKSDQSPLTEADSKSNDVIIKALRSLHPDIPIISEENKKVPYSERSSWGQFWLIDPLDGTKEFIKKNGEFTINIALIRDGLPVLGVVYKPVDEILYVAEKNSGAFKTEKNGMISIQPSTVPVTSSSSVLTSVSNYNTENSSLETFVNGEDRKDSEITNKQKYKNNFFREQIFILILFLIVLLILFQKKYKLFTI